MQKKKQKRYIDLWRLPDSNTRLSARHALQHTNRSAGAKRRQRRPRTPAQASGVRTHGPWHWRRAVSHAADTQIAGPNPVLGRSRTQGDDPTSRVVVRQLQRRYIYPTPTRANGHQKDDPQPPRNITFQKRETTCFRNITFVKHDVFKT